MSVVLLACLPRLGKQVDDRPIPLRLKPFTWWDRQRKKAYAIIPPRRQSLTLLAWFFYAISIFITWFTPICTWSTTLTEVQESKSLYPSCLTKFPNKLDGIWNYCWDLLVWWTSYSLYLVHSLFKGENPTYTTEKERRKNSNWLVFTHLQTNFFKPGMMIETTKLYILISLSSTFGWPWFHSPSQFHEKSKSLVSIFSESLKSFGRKFSYSHNQLVCWSSC